MNRPRIGAALVGAPFALLPLFAILALFFDYGYIYLLMGIYGVFIAFLGMVFVGIPVILLFHRLGATKWWHITLAGAPIPVAITLSNGPVAALSFGACGSFVALVAWFLAFCKAGDTFDRPTDLGDDSCRQSR